MHTSPHVNEECIACLVKDLTSHFLANPELRGAAGRPRKEKKRELPALTKMQRVYVRELQAKHGDDFEVRWFVTGMSLYFIPVVRIHRPAKYLTCSFQSSLGETRRLLTTILVRLSLGVDGQLLP